METPDTKPPEDIKRQRVSQLESAARFSALLAGAVYATGFMVVTIHHSQFGIVEFGFLRPRIFVAGTLFLILTLLPILALSRLFGLFGLRTSTEEGGLIGLRTRTDELVPASREHHAALRIALGCEFYFVCVVLAWICGSLFFTHTENLRPQGLNLFCVWFMVRFVSTAFQGKLFNKYPGRCMLLSFVLALALFALAFRYGDSSLFALSLWFYFVGILTLFYYHVLQTPKAREHQWERAALFFLLLSSFFAFNIYGKVKPYFGGGDANVVVLHFSAKVPEFSGDTAHVLLLEETESGYFVLQQETNGHAFFIRRDLVSEIEFINNKVQ